MVFIVFFIYFFDNQKYNYWLSCVYFGKANTNSSIIHFNQQGIWIIFAPLKMEVEITIFPINKFTT